MGAMGMLACGSLVACGGATQPPIAVADSLQTCEGGIARNDAELTAFAHCGLISGDLAVTAVESLAPLAELRAVRGTLTIAHTRVDDLTDLRSVASVGRLELRDNDQLSSLEGLAQLQAAREVVIHGNPELRTLAGLSGLRELERLSIQQTKLYSLHGLENVSKVNELELLGNRKLIDPRALNQMRQARTVIIRQNPRLCAGFGLLSGLQHTERVSVSENVALDRSAVQTLLEIKPQTTLASR